MTIITFSKYNNYYIITILTIMADEKTHALNLDTNRLVRKGSRSYIRQKKLGRIKELDDVDTEPVVQEEIQSQSSSEPDEAPPPSPGITRPDNISVHKTLRTTQNFDNDEFKSMMTKQFQQIIKENQASLVDLTQRQTDTLLKRLLMQKLQLNDDNKVKKVTKKTKTKKKTRFKLKPPSSSEESSDEESESE